MTYIVQRIDTHREAIYRALDSGDYLSAVQSRASQRELELLLEAIQGEHSPVNSERSPEQYYTTKEVAVVLKMDVTSVTRTAEKLRGKKRNNTWLFPKDYIDEEALFRQKTPKRGRKKSV